MVKTIDECFFQIQNGANIRQGNMEGGFPITRIETIANDKFNRDRMGYAGITDISKYEPYILEDGDLLMSHINSVQYLGRTVLYVREPGETIIHGMNLLRLKARKDIVDPAYVRYCFYGHSFRRQVNSITKKSVNQASFAITDLKKIKIDIPSVLEQKEIVKIMNKVHQVMELRENELFELNNLIKARFVEMFGDININDKNWNCEPLGDLCTIVRGGSPRPIEQFLGGDVPWIKIGDATDGDNIYLSLTKEHIIQEGVKKSRLVKSGSLIFANCGVSLGFARIITFDGCIHDGWLAMEDIDERLDKVFLLQVLNQMTEHFRAIAPAGTQPNLNTTIMKAYKQVIPPIELQRDFIRFAEQVNESKVAVQKALDETQKLFDSLMQQYFG